MSHPETIKVQPWSDDQGEFVLINKEDFDPAKHTEFKEGGKKPTASKARGKAVKTAKPAPDFASDEAGEAYAAHVANGTLSEDAFTVIEGTGEGGAITVGDIEDYVAGKDAK